MATHTTESTAESTSRQTLEIIALRRYVEFIKQQERLTELLAFYTPEQMITHLRCCSAAQCPRLRLRGEDSSLEKTTLLGEMLSAYALDEITDALKMVELAKQYGCGRDGVAAALHLRQSQNANKARYYAKRKEELNRKSVERIRAARLKHKLESAENRSGVMKSALAPEDKSGGSPTQTPTKEVSVE